MLQFDLSILTARIGAFLYHGVDKLRQFDRLKAALYQGHVDQFFFLVRFLIVNTIYTRTTEKNNKFSSVRTYVLYK